MPAPPCLVVNTFYVDGEPESSVTYVWQDAETGELRGASWSTQPVAVRAALAWAEENAPTRSVERIHTRPALPSPEPKPAAAPAKTQRRRARRRSSARRRRSARPRRRRPRPGRRRRRRDGPQAGAGKCRAQSTRSKRRDRQRESATTVTRRARRPQSGNTTVLAPLSRTRS